ncbi:hypothetical protein I552_10061 [Mycobacterium xenopi 3993]|nr:hypothetical protein I552_10061 [Mycobacterium xenopi 3993]
MLRAVLFSIGGLLLKRADTSATRTTECPHSSASKTSGAKL